MRLVIAGFVVITSRTTKIGQIQATLHNKMEDGQREKHPKTYEIVEISFVTTKFTKQ